jgi:hypothetical protein
MASTSTREHDGESRIWEAPLLGRTVVKALGLTVVAIVLQLGLYSASASIGPATPWIGLAVVVLGVGILLAPILLHRSHNQKSAADS